MRAFGDVARPSQDLEPHAAARVSDAGHGFHLRAVIRKALKAGLLPVRSVVAGVRCFVADLSKGVVSEAAGQC